MRDPIAVRRGLFMTVVVVLSVLAGAGTFAGVAAGAQDAVSISSTTEYGSGTIEIVFNQSVDSVDWVDVYIDGEDVGRIQSPTAGTRTDVTSPTGDVTPNRNLTVVTQVDKGSVDDQVLRDRDILVSATTINASDSAHRDLSGAAAAFQGEPIAFVSDGNRDTQVTVEERNGGTVFDVGTGTDSEVIVFDSQSLSPGASYKASFGTPSVTEWVNVSDLRLSANVVSETDRYLGQFVRVGVSSTNPNSDLTVELVNEFGTVVDTDLVNLGRDRNGFAALAAGREGTFSIEVTDNETGNDVSAGEVTFAVSPAALGRPVLSASLGREAFDPGEDTTLPITIVNRGKVNVSSLENPALTERVSTARGLIVKVDEDDEAPLTVRAGTYAFGSLPAGRLASLDVPVSIDESVEPGTYRVPINVTYRYTEEIKNNGTEVGQTVRRDLNVTVSVNRAPRFSVRNVTTTVRAGSTDTLAVTVQNVGDALANNSRVALRSPNVDLTVGGDRTATRAVGRWPTGQSRRLEFEVSTPAGRESQTLPLELTVVYEDEDGEPAESESRYVPVTPLPAQPFQLEADSSTLTVGEQGRLTGSVTNIGGERFENAVVVLADDHDALTPLENQSVVGTFPPNTSANFSFPIQVSDDAEPLPRQLGLFVRYRRSDDAVLTSPEMFAQVSMAPESPAFRLNRLNGSVRAGGSGYLNLTVRNTGNRSYTDIRVRLFASSPLSPPEDRQTIQRLESGASTRLSIPVGVSGGATPKAYPVSLILKYDESPGEREISETFRGSVEVLPPAQESSGVGALPVVVVVVVLAAISGLFVYTRRR